MKIFTKKNEKAELPSPLVRFHQHPGKWLGNLTKLGILGLIMGHIGTLIVIGAYYLLFQTTHSVKDFWDNMLTTRWPGQALLSQDHWDTYRHLLRNTYEGILGGILVQLVIWNHYKLKRTRPTKELRAWRVVALPVNVIFWAIPGLIVGYFTIHFVKNGLHEATLFAGTHGGGSYWSNVETIWTTDYDAKLVGFFGSVFLARRPMRKFADDAQSYFAARRIVQGKSLRFWHPPNFDARFNGMTEAEAASICRDTSDRVPAIMTGAIILGLGLAGFGYYVITEIATRH